MSSFRRNLRPRAATDVPRTRWSRFATAGLVAVVVCVSGFTLWVSQTTASAARDAAAASRLAEHYAEAVRAVIAEESLDRKYRLEPNPQIRHEHQQAGRSLVAALNRVHAEGDRQDRVNADVILATHADYLIIVQKMFAAVDQGDAAAIRRLDRGEAHPIFLYLQGRVNAAAVESRAEALAQLESLRRLQATMAQGVPLTFLVGLALAGMFASVLRRYRYDLDEQRRQAFHHSLHDGLTGLANRQLLVERLDRAVRPSSTDSGSVGLVLLDLDRFKEINDALGHRYGDELLTQIGPRLAGALRATDTVARLGGDEFAVLLPDVASVEDATAIAEKLLAATELPLTISGVDLTVEASAGVVLSGVHGDDAQTLLQRAEVAMYVAKQRNRGVAVYEASEDAHDPERLALLAELRRAIEQNELVLHYQPKIAPSTGAVCGVEALVRWQHPTRGMVPPDRFIPLAEHTGLIGPLTRYVLNAALGQARRWADEGRPLSVAVNLAARNLADPDLCDDVLRLLDQHGVPASLLCLELTESAITTEPEHARRVLGRLRAAGISLALDDFGAGYTSLGQLKSLPITELKIDRAFVATMTTDRSNGLIVRSIVDLAHNLGLTTVAEGVEDAGTLSALATYGCSVAQGFHMSRPLPADALDRWYDQTHAVGRVA